MHMRQCIPRESRPALKLQRSGEFLHSSCRSLRSKKAFMRAVSMQGLQLCIVCSKFQACSQGSQARMAAFWPMVPSAKGCVGRFHSEKQTVQTKLMHTMPLPACRYRRAATVVLPGSKSKAGSGGEDPCRGCAAEFIEFARAEL